MSSITLNTQDYYFYPRNTNATLLLCNRKIDTNNMYIYIFLHLNPVSGVYNYN